MKKIDVDLVHEELLKNEPILSFSPDVDYSNWKKQIYEKYIELLGLDLIEENQCSLDLEIEEVKEFNEFRRIRYIFKSENNVVVPCYLLLPKDDKEKHPVCICLQGHSTGFHISLGIKKYDTDERLLETHDFAIEAVKHGFAALAIEQRGMGERTTLHERRRPSPTVACYFPAMSALLLGRTIIGERVWDVHKAIESLETFKDKLDLNNISIMGNSGGGTTSYYAMCYDKRIKHCLTSCAISTYKDSIGDIWHCSCNYIPRIAKYVDMGDLAALIAPRRLTILSGELDQIFPIEGAREVYDTIKQIYEKEGASENVELVVIPDKGHYFDKVVAFDRLSNY